MSTEEMSAIFDTLFNNINSNQMPGLNEYEKSVFLTKAQSQLVNEYFNNRTDGFGGGFDGSQIRQYDFSNLIQTVKLAEILDTESSPHKVDSRSMLYNFPPDYYLAVNEVIKDDAYQYSVIPLTYMEYSRLMMKPYAYPVKRAAWRLITNQGEDDTGPTVEIIGKFKGEMTYTLRYVKTLTPIILEDLGSYGTEEPLKIDGHSAQLECKLPKECHHEIVERAVALAKIAWQGGTATQAAAQSNSNQ